MIKKKGIALKTFIFTSCLIALVVMISFAILYYVLPDYYHYTKTNRLQRNADILVQNLKSAESETESINLISDFSAENNSEVISFDSEGLMIPDFSSPFIRMEGETLKFQIKIARIHDSDQSEANIQLTERNNQGWYYSSTGAMEALSVVNFIKDIGNGAIDHITVTGTLQPVNEAQSVILSLIPFLLVIDLLIALLAAYFYAKRLSKPIITISDAASEMQKMTPGIQSGVRTDDELGILSQNLDDMYNSLCDNIESLHREMERVNQLEKSKTDFMRAASHELKTPITALNGIVEGMIDHVGIYKNTDKYLRESKLLIDHLTALVNEILGVSKLEAIEDTALIEPVDIHVVLCSLLRGYQLLIDEKELLVENESFNFVYYTDEKTFRTTLSNVISNALKYTAEKGKIHIDFIEEEDGAVLSVENQSEHIPEQELPKIFEPFYTPNYSRHRSKSGTGLGLYIVRKNLERLQLPYKIENTPLGIKFSIKFTEIIH